MKQLNISCQHDTKFFTFAYAYDVMMNLNSRMLKLELFLKNYVTVIMWGKWLERKVRRERQGIPILTKIYHGNNNNNKN